MDQKEKLECPDCGTVFENRDTNKELICECGAVLISEEQELAEQLLAEELSRKWYYSHDKNRYGPVPWNRIKEFINSRKLGPEDLIWSRGMESWEEIRAFPELIECFPENVRPELKGATASPVTGSASGLPDKSPAASAGKVNRKTQPSAGKPATLMIRICSGFLAALGFFQIVAIPAAIYAALEQRISPHHATWLVAAFISGAVIFTGISQLIKVIHCNFINILDIREQLAD